jgi:hypothetical protein
MLRRASLVAALLFGAGALPAAAITVNSVVTVAYVAAYEPVFGGPGVPYTGVLRLRFNAGTVNGTYSSRSVMPDPLYGRIVPVIGGTDGKQIHFSIGNVVSVHGTISPDGRSISGTATRRGRTYEFLALEGTPKGG